VSTGKTRLRPLDGLRGLAAVGVLIDHYLYTGPLYFHALGHPIAFAKYGAQGVELFFVISGFVITMTLRRGTVRDFVASRISRLFPTYWAAIVLTTVTLLFLPLPGHRPHVEQFLVNLTMLQSYVGVGHIDGSYWTLGIELAFYVQAAVLWRSGLLSGPKLIPTLYAWVLAATVISLLIHGGPQSPGTPIWAHDVLQTLAYIPWFVCGIVALLIVEGRRGWRLYGVAIFAELAMVLLDHQKNIGLFGGLYMLVILTVLTWRPLGTTWRPLLFFGDISYALYLVHQIVGQAVMVWLEHAGLPRFFAVAVAAAVAILLATAITRWIDRPLRRRVRSLIAARRTADPSPTVSTGL
jgi:peptidoglycan/LPS O-acetylase OafA/YrhL